jgi:hypothetical protein
MGKPVETLAERAARLAEEGLDRSHRYLRPVARLDLPGHSDDTHWSVYEWLPQFEAWATGPAICGYSTSQGSLPEGTAVTCEQCEERRPDYERYLDPGYRPNEKTPEQQLREARGLLSQWAPDLMKSHPVLFRKLDALLQLSQRKDAS